MRQEKRGKRDEGRGRMEEGRTERRISSVRDLEVYKLAFEAAMGIYELSKTFPKEEVIPMTKLKIRRMKDDGRRTKRILTGFFVSLLSSLFLFSSSFVPLPSSFVYAEIPRLIHYQGRLVDKETQKPADGLYVMKFILYDEPGAIKWQATYGEGEGSTPVSVSKGVFSVKLGEISDKNSPKFSELDFAEPYYLEIAVRKNQPNSQFETLGTRQPLTSAGYAIRAEKAGVANDINIPAQQGDILYFNGTNWTKLPAGNSGDYLKTQGAGANPAWSSTLPFKNIQVFRTSGTWIKPANVNKVYVKLWGGGGGGGNGVGVQKGGGGGGGGYAEAIINVSDNAIITVGGGGGDGGDSSFVGDSTVTVRGGKSGMMPSGGTGAGGSGGGGTTSGVNIVIDGATGQNGGSGGSSFCGAGGAGGVNVDDGTPGANGGFPGGGGGGGGAAAFKNPFERGGGAPGGTGAAGLVIVYW